MQKLTITEPGDRTRFQFSTPWMQTEEAFLNARETRAILARHVRPIEVEQEEPTAAGACFRKVSKILAGKGEK